MPMHTSSRLRIPGAGPLLFSLAFVAAAPARAQSISPKFAWPTTATAEVTSSGDSRTTLGGKLDSARYRTRSRIEVRPDARGLLISSGPTETLEGAVGGANGPSMAGMLSVVTRYLVSREGRFLELTDTVTMKRQLDSAAQPFMAQMASLPPQMREGFSRVFSIATMQTQAERNWWQQTGALISRSWAPGDSLVLRYDEPLPTLPGAKIPFTQVMRYAGAVSCPAGSSVSACWRFSSSIDVDKGGLRSAMLQMLKQMGVDDESMIDQIPIPITRIAQTLVYDAATSRLVEQTVETRVEAPGAPAMNVPPTSARTDVVTRYTWK
jgi:hypothetical protein